MRSSGMCKAGFAGDDAPRAVFRKSHFSTFLNPMLHQLDINKTDLCCSFDRR